MLQPIHHNSRPSPASSLYCRWIREEHKPGAPLAAIWMDTEMRAFQREPAPETAELLSDAWDEPGGAVPVSLWMRLSVREL